jgi:hypothetical protein
MISRLQARQTLIYRPSLDPETCARWGHCRVGRSLPHSTPAPYAFRGLVGRRSSNDTLPVSRVIGTALRRVTLSTDALPPRRLRAIHRKRIRRQILAARVATATETPARPRLSLPIREGETDCNGGQGLGCQRGCPPVGLCRLGSSEEKLVRCCPAFLTARKEPVVVRLVVVGRSGRHRVRPGRCCSL